MYHLHIVRSDAESLPFDIRLKLVPSSNASKIRRTVVSSRKGARKVDSRLNVGRGEGVSPVVGQSVEYREGWRMRLRGPCIELDMIRIKRQCRNRT